MAKAMQAKGTKGLVWILIGLLILGLAGFGVSSFTSSVQAVGSVGDEEITVDEYLQALQGEIDSFARYTGQRLPPSEAIQLGMNHRALENLVFRATVDNEAKQIGLSVGDQTVFNELTSMQQFQGVDGNFNRQAYEFVLERSGMSASEFDATVREGQVRQLLQSTVGDGFPASEPYVDRLVSYYLSTREVTWARVPAEMLEGEAPAAAAEDLRAYYDQHPDEFTLPETRHVTYAWVTPEMIADPETVSEQRLRELYAERGDEYSRPERRDIDRLVFSDLRAAQTAKQRLDSGAADFEAIAAEMGVLLSDIHLGLVSRDALSGNVAEAVFGAEDTRVVGPVASDLGPALYRINAVLGEQLTAFADARPGLAGEVALDIARQYIADRTAEYEDLLAGGAAVEQLAAETRMESGAVAFNALSREGITAFNEFRAAVQAAAESDFPEIGELAGGGVFAFRLDRIDPPAVEPFADVRDRVRAAWDAKRLSDRLSELAESLIPDLHAGAGFEKLGLAPESETELMRGRTVSGSPPGLADAAFSIPVGDAAVFGDGASWGVLRVEAEFPPTQRRKKRRRPLSCLRRSLPLESAMTHSRSTTLTCRSSLNCFWIRGSSARFTRSFPETADYGDFSFFCGVCGGLWARSEPGRLCAVGG